MFPICLFLLLSCQAAAMDKQSHFFDLVKDSLSGDSLSKWDSNHGNSYCNCSGIACNDRGNIVQIDISGWSLVGKFPDQVCSYLPEVRVLRLGDNRFDGGFPRGIVNCSFLEELNLSSLYLTGHLPDLSPLISLRIIDLSYNLFSGKFPVSITNMTNLEFVNFNENVEFDFWQMPDSITRLRKLEWMILTTCKMRGKIPPCIGNMTSLIDLELSGNYLVGPVPKEIGLMRNLEHIEMYYNQLEGEIPGELGNLTYLRDLDMSVNMLSGRIPESVCRLPNLQVLQFYNNSLVGEIPGSIGNSTTLRTLSLYGNALTGEVPQNLGKSSIMLGIDLSENRLFGRLPDGLCSGGKLRFLLMLQNLFTGELPTSYSECKSLFRVRLSHNNMGGRLPEGILSLPNATVIDVGYNHFTGFIPGSIKYASALTELFLQGNKISGTIPPEIALAVNLVKIDLSNNLISGPIPSEISNLRKLNLLFLQGNMLNSSIPDSLAALKSLNVLDLSSNRLSGKIPERLGELLPNLLNFSNNQLSGPIPMSFIKGGLLESFSGNPGLCVPDNLDVLDRNFTKCHKDYRHKKMNYVWLIGIFVGILVVGTIMFVRRWFNKKREVMETEDTLSSSFFPYNVRSFHRLSFDQREIIGSMVEKNIVGYGGSGTVYKIELNNGQVVAVKELWNRKGKDSSASEDQLILDRELKTEVETLGSIRHNNIVKLYCYFSSLDSSLLVYEYMPNGNLWDALHIGKVLLDWPMRYQIALGVAQGIAYLHHHLTPPIIHRDIKSTNILLDINYHPKVADFGIAKVLKARDSMDSSTTVIAGTYGYLAPEYVYSSKVTTKCDVYSFGVVLMELVTGKKPVEAEFGENKNIIYWVATKVETNEGMLEVLDKRAMGSFKEDMMKVLGIAIRCSCEVPNLRPTMNEVVQLLMEVDPCKFDCCKGVKQE